MRGSWRPLLVLGGGRGLASLLGFAAVALTAHRLTADELGRWSLALAVQGFALHAAELGLRSVATADAPRAGAALPRLLRRYLALRLVLAGLVLAAVGASATLLLPAGGAGLVLLTATAVLPIALQLDWLALAQDRATLAGGLLLVRPAAFLALLLALPHAAGAGAVALAYLAAWWLAAAASWVTWPRRPAAATAEAPPLAPLGDALRRGLRLAGVTLTNQAQLSLDLLAVGWALGAAAAADYYLASGVAVAGLLFANAAGQSALAQLGALAERPTVFAAGLRLGLRHLLALALVLAAALAGAMPWLAVPAFGAGHAETAGILLWLLPWLVLQHLTTLLQAAAAAARLEGLPLRANGWMLAALAGGLPLAALTTLPAAFALVRAAAEALRLALLARGLAQAGLLGPGHHPWARTRAGASGHVAAARARQTRYQLGRAS